VLLESLLEDENDATFELELECFSDEVVLAILVDEDDFLVDELDCFDDMVDDDIEVELEVLLGTDVEELDCLDVEIDDVVDAECELLLNKDVVELSVSAAVDFVVVGPTRELDVEGGDLELEDEGLGLAKDEGLKLGDAELELDLVADQLLDVEPTTLSVPPDPPLATLIIVATPNV